MSSRMLADTRVAASKRGWLPVGAGERGARFGSSLDLAFAGGFLWLWAALSAVSAAGAEIAITPPQRSAAVSFESEILPLFSKSCLACHSAAEKQAGLVLESADAALKGGDSGPAVKAGDSAGSLLLKLASHRGDPAMPPPDNDVNAPPLTPAELGLIKLWIDEGARGGPVVVLSPKSWRPLPPGVNPILATAVTADGQYAACSRANQIFIYHVPTGQIITRLTDPALAAGAGDSRPGVAHLDLVQTLAFNQEGDMLASGGFRELKLWRRPRDIRRWESSLAGGATAVAVSPDGALAAVAGADHSIRLIQQSDGKATLTLSGHADRVTRLVFSPDGERLFSSSLDQSIRAWQVRDGAAAGRIDSSSPQHDLAIIPAAASPPGEAAAAGEPSPAAAEPPAPAYLLASAGEDKFVHFWRPPLEQPSSTPDRLPGASRLAVTRDGQFLALVDAAGKLQVVDSLSNKTIAQWELAGKSVTSMSLYTAPPAEGKVAGVEELRLAVADAAGQVELWSVAAQRLESILRSGPLPVESLAVHAGDEKSGLLALGAADGHIGLWPLRRPAASRLGPPAPDGAPAPAAAASPDPKPAVLPADPLATGAPARILAATADGKRLAVVGTAGKASAVLIRDRDTGLLQLRLLGHVGEIRCVAFDPAGQRVATGGVDGLVRIWSLAENDAKFPEIARLEAHEGGVESLAWSADGGQLLTGGADKFARLWKTDDGQLVQAFAGHAASVTAVAFAGATPLSASLDKTLRWWNPAAPAAVRTVSAPAAIQSLAVTPDGAKVVVGADKALIAYQVSDGKLLHTLNGHQQPPHSLQAAADNARLLSVGAGEAVVWDLAAGRPLEMLVAEGLAGGLWDSQPQQLILGDSLGGVEVQPLQLARMLPPLAGKVIDLAFSLDGAQVFAAAEDGAWRRYNAATGAAELNQTHGSPLRSMALSPDGNLVATGGANGQVRVWNAANAAPLLTPFTGFKGPVTDVCFSLDNARVLGAGETEQPAVLAFELTGNLPPGGIWQQQLLGAKTALAEIAAIAAPTGLAVVAIAPSESPLQWRLHSDGRLAGHTQAVTSLAWVPDATPPQLISGSLDNTIRRWNLDNRQLLAALNHGGPVTAVAVRHDGQRIGSASSNNTARLWNINGQQIAVLQGDVRRQNLVVRQTQEQTAATARQAAAKQRLDAAEKALPESVAAEKAATEALAKANQDVTAKQAAVKVVEDAKTAAEKLAIEAAALAQQKLLATTEADEAATEAKRKSDAAALRAARLATIAQATPAEPALQQSAEQSKKDADAAAAAAQVAAAAQQAPAQALQQATQAAVQATTKAVATQKPYTDAVAALRTAEAAQNLAAQQHVLAVREKEEATAAVPAAKLALEAGDKSLAEAKAALEAATKLAAESAQPIRTIAFSPDGQLLATGGDFASVHTWDAETGQAVAAFAGHAGPIQQVVFASNEALLSGGDDGVSALWEVSPGWELERTIGAVDDPSVLSHRVTSVAFSPDGAQVVAAGGIPSRGGEVKVWNTSTGSLVLDLPQAHDDTIYSVSFSPDGKRLATAGADKYMRTFDAASGELLRRFEGHTNYVLGVAWQSDGQTLATAAADNTVKIWNAETGDQLRTIANFEKHVTSVRFVGDTTNIVSSSGDKIARIHNSANGGLVRNFGGATKYLHCVDVTPNGQVLLAGDQDSVLRIWNGANGQLLHALAPPDDGPATREADPPPNP